MSESRPSLRAIRAKAINGSMQAILAIGAKLSQNRFTRDRTVAVLTRLADLRIKTAGIEPADNAEDLGRAWQAGWRAPC